MIFGVVMLAGILLLALAFAVPAALIVRKAGFGGIAVSLAFLSVSLLWLMPYFLVYLATSIARLPPAGAAEMINFATMATTGVLVVGLWLFAFCSWPALKR